MTDQTHKKDAGKLEYRLVPPAALQQVVEALTYGAAKYTPHSWRLVESFRYVDAVYRHLEMARKGETHDEESALPHLAMAITNLMFLLERQEISNESVFSYYEEAEEEAARLAQDSELFEDL